MGETNLKFVSDVEALRHWDKVAEAQDAAQRKVARRHMLRDIALVACIPVAASGWLAWAIRPRIETQVEIIPMMADGTPARAFRLEDMPPEVQGDVAVSTAWGYVQAWESYSRMDEDDAFKLIYAMSDSKTWQKFFDKRDPNSKTSLYQTLGKSDRIHVAYDSFEHVVPAEGYDGPPPGYKFRFWRTEFRENNPPNRQMYQSAMMFRRNVKQTNNSNIYQFNPPRLQIWDYKEGQPVGVQPGRR